MDEKVKKELEKQINQINKDFEFILDGSLPTDELIKMEFKGIRILIDYCEKLALEGKKAIEII